MVATQRQRHHLLTLVGALSTVKLSYVRLRRGILLPTMTRYLVLLRGINVGGKNKVPMAALRDLLEELGHTDVRTYIASGNAILSSDRSAAAIKRQLEEALPKPSGSIAS